jgi:hypothetical protein
MYKCKEERAMFLETVASRQNNGMEDICSR